MPIESYPKHLVPRNYASVQGTPYKVRDYETWHSVASDHNLDVDTLIWFNFDTHNTDEVNWYLHYYVGCKLHDAKNWKFSKDANPGIIYLYPRSIIKADWSVSLFDGGLNGLARFLDDHADEVPENHMEQYNFILDAVEITHISLAVIGSEAIELSLGVTVLEVLAPFAAEAAVFLSLGAAYADTIESLKRNAYTQGLSEGIVLGTNRAASHWVAINFWKKDSVANSQLPEQGKNVQNFYNLGLATGYRYGKQLNKKEAKLLFHELNVNMPPIRSNPEDDDPDYWAKWDSNTRRIYYGDAAIVFKRLHMPK